MADAAWAELCGGEESAKRAAAEKLLRKAKEAKVVEKKRQKVLKTKKKKGALPLSAAPESVPEPVEAAAP